MKQKSTPQVVRPKLIKLTPFSPLPKLTLTASPSHFDSLPSISTKSKPITSSSEHQLKRRERIKTEQAPAEKEDESASFRVISRFIYNHLQKKLNFQAQVYKQYQECGLSNDADSGCFDSEQRLFQEDFNIKHNKYIGNPIKEVSRSQILKFKNKLSLKAKAAQRSLTKDDTKSVHRNRNRYANIDSYFDLSCLDNCNRRE